MYDGKHIAPRSNRLLVAGHDIQLPTFFPSVSSVKTSLAPYECLRVLVAVRYPHFLVSAYDVNNSAHGKRMVRHLGKGIKDGATVLLDSGNYEGYWSQDKHWTFDKYLHAIRGGNYHLAFSFDNQEPSKNVTSNARDIEKRVTSTIKRVPQVSIIPIIHGKSSDLPRIARMVAKRLRPLMLAIPERALGEGLIARVKTLYAIRREMQDLGEYLPIHLLGTGNPLSLLLFSAFGADSFDGLEWCQTAVDHSTGLLHHFQQRELFSCQCPFCKAADIPYAQTTLAHNLDFYLRWTEYLRASIANEKVDEALRAHFSTEFLSSLQTEIERT